MFNQKPQRCLSFALSFPPFTDAGSVRASRVALHFSQPLNQSGNWNRIAPFIPLSLRKLVESLRNNSRKEKTSKPGLYF